MGAFEFVVLATLRAAQLMRGCLPRVDGTHRPTITAQCEVAEGKVTQMPRATSGVVEPGAALLGEDEDADAESDADAACDE